MPIGEHLARCLNCGKAWIVGDCIPAFCSDSCSKAHAAFWKAYDEEQGWRKNIELVDDHTREIHEADRV